MENFNLTIDRSKTIEVTITGIDSWTDILAKLFAVQKNSDTVKFELAGSINETTNVVTFEVLYDTLDGLSASELDYEVILYKADKSFVQTVTSGIISLENPRVEDPTI